MILSMDSTLQHSRRSLAKLPSTVYCLLLDYSTCDITHYVQYIYKDNTDSTIHMSRDMVKKFICDSQRVNNNH